MQSKYVGILVWTAVIIVSCGSDTKPTATPIPPTDTPSPTATQELTDTPVSPTNTLSSTAIWTPTSTPIPPAQTSSVGKLVFISKRDGNWEVYVMNANGSNQRRLTNTPAYESEPSWSPNSHLIVYSSIDIDSEEDLYQWDSDADIYVMNTDGSNPRKLTNNDLGWANGPVWSPDGRLIAFYFGRDIHVMNADGTDSRNLTANNPATTTYPSWSPDGRFIAFHSHRNGNWDIYVMNADGTDERRLTDDPADDWVPSWSPDGRSIAFWSSTDEKVWNIYLMNIDGTNRRKLTDEPPLPSMMFDISRPAWSPDGRFIAFVSGRDGNGEIYVMNADGSNQIRLTNDPAGDWMPAWSPGLSLPVLGSPK